MIEKITLPNGIRILLDPAPFFKTASFGFWIGTGSRYENEVRQGISHFIEHMLFKGTTRRTTLDISVETDLFGGQLNAYTSKEYTCYYAHTLEDHVPPALDLLCDMLTGSTFTQSDIETERGVIFEEIAMYEDSGEDLALDQLCRNIWPGSPLGAPILGSNKSVAALSRADMRDYMATHYAPEHLIFSICGQFDRDAVLSILTHYFGDMPKSGLDLKPDLPDYHHCITLAQKDFEQTSLVLAFPGMAMNDERRFALAILHNIAGGGASSHLFQRLREELGLVYSIYSYSILHHNAGLFGITATVMPDSEEQALGEILLTLATLRTGITEKEVTRAKEHYKVSLVMSMEGILSRAAHAGRSELLNGSIFTEDELIAKIEAVRHEDVLKTAYELLNPANISLSAAGRLKPHAFYEELITAWRNGG